MKKTVGVIIVAQNAQDIIGMLLEKLLGQDFLEEIIFVDDGSTDKTLEEVQRMPHPKLRLFHFDTPKGRTKALEFALPKAKADVLAIWSGSLEYDPEDLMNLISPVLESRVNLILGSRFITPMFQVLPSYFSVCYQKTLSCWNGFFLNKYFSDVLCDLMAFDASLVRDKKFTDTGHAFNIEFLSQLKNQEGLLSWEVAEVPVKYSPKFAKPFSFSQFLTLLFITFEIHLKRIFKL